MCVRSQAVLPTVVVTGVALLQCLGLGPGPWRPQAASAQDATADEATPADPAQPVPAQPVPVQPGQPVPAQPGGKPGQPGGKPAQPGGKPMPGKPGEKPGSGKDGKPMKTPAVVQRPEKPEAPPNPKELEVRPDGKNQLKVSFRGQPWPQVLEWLADVSNMSLDWLEVPGGFLNLSMQRPYSIEETQDLINRHLLARGFTMLKRGEFLTVVSTKKVDPALVPRVSPTELSQRQPHEFVKVSFRLDWLVAADLSKELKPMLSPNGKLLPLTATNRIEAMDAVQNLREVAELLREEQSADGQGRLVKEFPLEHTRADEVLLSLREFLGIKSKSAPAAPMSPEQMQMAQQQAMMAAQMQQQRMQANPGAAAGPKKAGDVHLIANRARNSILASAAPDKLAMIGAAVRMLDVAAPRQLQAVHVYRLGGLSAKQLVQSLKDVSGLAPHTRLQVDEQNNAVIAYASVDDHFTIRALVDKLDSTGREFEVIPLRRLDALEVAGTIEYMMVGPPPKQQRRTPYFDFYPFGLNRNNDDQKKQDRMRVDADVDNNRLLLWVNEIELNAIHKLLAKLGEATGPGGLPRNLSSSSRVRLLEGPLRDDEAAAFERLRRVWSTLSPNPLVLPKPAALKDTSGQPAVKPTGNKPVTNSPSPADRDARRRATGPIVDIHLARLQRTPPAAKDAGAPSRQQLPAEPSAAGPSAAEPPKRPLPPAGRGEVRQPGGDPAKGGQGTAPVVVSRAADGRLIVASRDARALDLLEELLGQLSPARRDHHVFQVRNATAYWIMLNLEDYFKEDDDKKRGSSMPWWAFDGLPVAERQEAKRRMSNRRKLKFISDPDTNTILVQGATAAQLRIIDELIRLYDVPEPVNQKAARVTRLFTIRYSKASVVATAIKDAYRDLLSSNDRALLDANKSQQKPPSENTYITNFGDQDQKKERKTPVTFKGKLSIGIDELSNTLLVSAEGESLLSTVGEMIEGLDRAAMPTTNLRVVKLQSGGVEPAQLRRVLSQLLNRDRGGNQPVAPATPKAPAAARQPPVPVADPTPR